MIEYSKILWKWLEHIWIDFYELEWKIYFWEMTLTPHAGLGKISPEHHKKDKELWNLFLVKNEYA